MNSIIVQNLTKKFGDFISVDDISFNVKQGEIFGFLGSNGAGKSTTIKMLCGILAPTSGNAEVAGYSIVKEPDKVKEKIGYMSQRFSLYDDLTVEENINFFGGIYGISGKLLAERKKWVKKIADLTNREKLLTGSLPGGIKQRLALGTAVIHNPGIVFLDEPTSGVDPISRRNFWELINELSDNGITVFVTTHYLEEAEFCNNIILINAGKLIAEGNSKTLKTKYLDSDILEISCSNPIKAMEVLEGSALVTEVSIFGTLLHVFVKKDETNNLGKIKIYLEENNIQYSKVEKVIPTLEDVFIYLLDKKYNV